MTAAVLLGAAVSSAQPLAPECYSPQRDAGWVGPRTSIGCLPCCNCVTSEVTTQWQLRRAVDAWGAQPITSFAGRFSGTPFLGLTHVEPYCLRVRYTDDGGTSPWGPTASVCGVAPADRCFTWDEVPPTTPAVLDAGVRPGTNEVVIAFQPSTDDGGGVVQYRVHYTGPFAPSISPFGGSTGSPITDIIGAGTWSLTIFAEDRAENRSLFSTEFTVSAGFDASVSAPGAPTWPSVVTNQAYTTLSWPDDGADSWVVTQQLTDGGWEVAFRPRVDSATAYLPTPGPCRVHQARIARVLGDQVGPWSPPSPGIQVDTVPPTVSAPLVVSRDGGLVLLQWAAAVDGCPSGSLSYRLERSVNGGPWATRSQTGGLAAPDALDVVGDIQFRVVVIDDAGNQGTSPPSVTLIVSPDAGSADAGSIDAGFPDAGAADAGSDGGALDAGDTDAGSPAMIDAGALDTGPDDAGAAADAGFDGGFRDAGPVDAGGATPDGGDVGPRRVAVGCSCDTSGVFGLFGAMLLVATRRTRRVSQFLPRGR